MPPRRLPAISVLMPTHQQARFIRRPLESLLAQSRSDWALVVVNDDSHADTHETVRPYLADERTIYRRLRANRGLGAALNVALSLAHAPLNAYLPSDDATFASIWLRLSRRWSDIRTLRSSTLGCVTTTTV